MPRYSPPFLIGRPTHRERASPGTRPIEATGRRRARAEQRPDLPERARRRSSLPCSSDVNSCEEPTRGSARSRRGPDRSPAYPWPAGAVEAPRSGETPVASARAEPEARGRRAAGPAPSAPRRQERPARSSSRGGGPSAPGWRGSGRTRPGATCGVGEGSTGPSGRGRHAHMPCRSAYPSIARRATGARAFPLRSSRS